MSEERETVLPDPIIEARKAREHSRTQFLHAVDAGVEVRRVTSSLENHARQNHWGEGLQRLWEMGKGHMP